MIFTRRHVVLILLLDAVLLRHAMLYAFYASPLKMVCAIVASRYALPLPRHDAAALLLFFAML